MTKMKKSKAILIMLILFSLSFTQIKAQYGEDRWLFQDTDEITDHSYWGFNQSIAHNATADALELSITSTSVEDYENFSLYSVVDEDGDFTVNETHIEWSSMRRDADSFITYDFGANFFHDFNYTFVIKIDSIEAGDATGADIGGFMCFSTINGSVVDQGADDTIMVRARQEGANDDLFRWYLLQRHNGATKVSIIQALGTNNPMDTYYCRLYRSGTNITFWAYTDEAMTALNARLTSNAADDADSFQYHIPVAAIETPSDPADHSDGFFFNDWLGNYSSVSAYATEGYIFGIDLLNVNDTALVDLLNATIPAGDSITIQYSSNNVTWVDSHGAASHETLVDGHNAIDLRDLNYTGDIYRLANWTNTGADSTPRLLEARMIHFNGTIPIGNGTTTTVTEIHWGIVIALCLVTALVIGVKVYANN